VTLDWVQVALGTGGASILFSMFGGIGRLLRNRLQQPKKNEEGIKELGERIQNLQNTFSEFVGKYEKNAKDNKESQRVLFTVQDKQFSVMGYQTAAIREVTKSVCNGNKDRALQLCDDADIETKNGRDIHKDYLLGK